MEHMLREGDDVVWTGDHRHGMRGKVTVVHWDGVAVAWDDPAQTVGYCSSGLRCVMLASEYDNQGTMDRVFRAVQREIAWRKAKWGNHGFEVGSWILLMQKELEEARDGWCASTDDIHALREILQVIALGVSCLEQHGVIERSEIR